jgi:hypothetical protein
MKAFNQFASHPFGAWIINGLAVVAFILLLKVIANGVKIDSGPIGAGKAAINAI